jgi:hypothetical protein
MNRLKIALLYLVPAIAAYFYLTWQFVSDSPAALYNETRKMALNGIVTRAGCGKDFNIQINNTPTPIYINATVTVLETTKNEQECLVAVGDSIFKKEGCDTFYVYRGNESYIYVLP